MTIELNDLFFEIHRDLPREGPGRDQCTERAFRMLPPMDTPRILDIGCGPGAPTVALARLGGGEVIGIDVHQPYLDQLQVKIDAADLGHRVRAVNCSMFDIEFPHGNFDIVWAEGSIFIIGFERGLQEWQRLIRQDGFLVVHDVAWLRPDPPQEIVDFWLEEYPEITTVPERLRQIETGGYHLVGHFPLPEDAWWHEYYGPLAERIEMLRTKHPNDAKALATFDEHDREIEMFRKYSQWYGSVFLVMQLTA